MGQKGSAELARNLGDARSLAAISATRLPRPLFKRALKRGTVTEP